MTKRVGFDSIEVPSYGHIEIENGYKSLNWINFTANAPNDDTTLTDSGFYRGVTSGSQDAYDTTPNPCAVWSNQGVFNIQSVELTAGFDTNLIVDIRAFRAGVEVFDESVTINDAAPTKVGLHLTGVDYVEFAPVSGTADHTTPGQGNFIVFDDFVFSNLPKQHGSMLQAVAEDVGFVEQITTRAETSGWNSPHQELSSLPLHVIA